MSILGHDFCSVKVLSVNTDFIELFLPQNTDELQFIR